MAEGDFIDVIEDEIDAGVTWVKDKAVAFYHWASPLVQEAIQGFKNVVVDQVLGAAAAFVQRVIAMGRNLSLPDLEQAFLMAIEHLGGPLWDAVKTFASNLLQTLLGGLHLQAQATA